MAIASVSRLAHARIIPPDQGEVFRSPAETVRQVLQADASYLARTRTWHFGGIKATSDHVMGRLGYMGKEDNDLFDPTLRDFKHEAVVRGQAATFAVRSSDLVVVYERRRAGMPEREFVRGFQFMLREADRRPEWSVVSMDGKASFEEWLDGVDLVHRFRFRAEGPKLPREPRSPILGALLHPRPELMTIDFRAKSGVDVTDQTVRELVRMANGGLGEAFAVGRKNAQGAAAEQKAWASANSAERVVQEVPLDPQSGEISEETLLTVLAAIPLDNPW